MTINPSDAATSLNDIAAIERRTREALAYARSSVMMALWGTLCVIGYVYQYLRPGEARPVWIAIWAVGFAAMIALSRRRARTTLGAQLGQNLLRAQFILVAYGFVLLLLLWPVEPRQVSVFWPTLIMMGCVMAGLWLGRFFIYLGLSVTALTLIGYFWSGDWLPLWMAVTNGGGLIAAGAWLRRLGA